MALQVIGAGLGRTGTLSLKMALEKLGYGPCHHMMEVKANPEEMPFWNRAGAGEPVDWEEVFARYRSSVDWPSCHFYAQLAERYPEAKVILSRRDPERWYESMSKTILKMMEQSGRKNADQVSQDDPLRFTALIVSEQTFGGDFSREKVIAAFNRHDRKVRETIPAERLLVFEASDGWEPLCRFLEVPIPDEPYPRSNSSKEFWELPGNSPADRARLAEN